MGDDVLSHEIEFDVPEDMTVKDFFWFSRKGTLFAVYPRK